MLSLINHLDKDLELYTPEFSQMVEKLAPFLPIKKNELETALTKYA